MDPIEVYKGKTVELPVSLWFNVADDVITSDIRTEDDGASTIIASWDVSFKNDGTDGELILKLDYQITSEISQSTGYMDLKRVSGGDPADIFPERLEVVFIEEAP